MKRERVRRRGSWAWALVGALGITALGGGPLPVAAADGASPEADKILRSTCAYLAGLEAFSMTADLDNEVITQQGQKVQFSSHGRMVIQRPDREKVRAFFQQHEPARLTGVHARQARGAVDLDVLDQLVIHVVADVLDGIGRGGVEDAVLFVELVHDPEAVVARR